MRGYSQLLCLTGYTTDLATFSLLLLYYCINVAMPESFICDVYVSALQDFLYFWPGPYSRTELGLIFQDVGGLSIIGLP